MKYLKIMFVLLLTVIIAAGCTVEKTKDQKKGPKASQYNPNAEVAVDFGLEGQIAVTLSDTNKLSLIDMSTLKVGDTVDVGVNPQDVAFTPDGRLYYAVMTGIWKDGGGTPLQESSALSNDAVWYWQTHDHKINGKSSTAKSDDLVRPVGVAVTNSSDRVLIANMSVDELLIRNVGGSQEEIARVPVGAGPRRVLITPDNKYAITINSDLEDRAEKDSVSIVHLLSFEEEARVEVGPYPWAGAVASDSKNFYVSISGTDEVVKINIDKREVMETYKIGSSPRGIALSPDDKTLYVASYKEDQVLPFNLESKAVGQGLSTGKGPQELAMTKGGNLLLVANYDGKSITVINVSQEKIVETIRLQGSPSSIAAYTGTPPKPSSAGRYTPDSKERPTPPVPQGVNKAEPSSTKPSEKGK